MSCPPGVRRMALGIFCDGHYDCLRGYEVAKAKAEEADFELLGLDVLAGNRGSMGEL